MQFGKIVNNELVLAPNKVVIDGMQVFNPTNDMLLQAGYKQIQETSEPEEPAPIGQHYESYYEDMGLFIQQVWKLVDDSEVPPKPESIETRMAKAETQIITLAHTVEPMNAVLSASEITAQSYNDVQALKVMDVYRDWQSLCDESYTAEKKGYKFTYAEKLYKTRQDGFTFQAQWIPGEGTGSIYEQITESHKGTTEDPIPVPDDVNTNPFVYVVGKYYIESGVLYKCQREGDEEGKEYSLNYKPSELIGHYFVKVEAETKATDKFKWI